MNFTLFHEEPHPFHAGRAHCVENTEYISIACARVSSDVDLAFRALGQLLANLGGQMLGRYLARSEKDSSVALHHHQNASSFSAPAMGMGMLTLGRSAIAVAPSVITTNGNMKIANKAMITLAKAVTSILQYSDGDFAFDFRNKCSTDLGLSLLSYKCPR